AWRTAQSTASLPADRRLPGAIAANCGAVGPGAALVSHSQRSPQALSEGPSTRPAAAPGSGLNSRDGCEEPQNRAGDPRLTAGFRITDLTGGQTTRFDRSGLSPESFRGDRVPARGGRAGPSWHLPSYRAGGPIIGAP